MTTSTNITTTMNLRERALAAAREAREAAERERQEREERNRQEQRRAWLLLSAQAIEASQEWIADSPTTQDPDAELVYVDGIAFRAIELRYNGPSLVLAERCNDCGAVVPHPPPVPYEPVTSLTKLGYEIENQGFYVCDDCNKMYDSWHEDYIGDKDEM